MANTKVDAFLSYNEKERTRVAPISEWLEARGVKTHYWRRDIPVGDPISEERQLLDARTVVALLGSAGWGPTHIKQVAGAVARKTPVLPVLIGDPPAAAFDEIGGLFKDKRYLDLRTPDEGVLNELREQIGRHATRRDGRAEYLIQLLIDGSDDQRHEALEEVQRGKSFDGAVLAARLRAEIEGPYSPAAQARFASAARDTQKIGSIRSWMLSTLLWCEHGSDATRDLVLNHVGPDEPDRNVRFWTLAGLYFVKASYLNSAIELAARDERGEISDLAKAIAGNPTAIDELRTKLSSNEFEVAWQVLRALRVVPIASLADDIARQLLREAEGTALTYDVLYALSNPPIAAAAANTLQKSLSTEAVVDAVVKTAVLSNRAATRYFANLLGELDRELVRTALTATNEDPRERDAARYILLTLNSRSPPPGTQPVHIAGFISDSATHQADQLGILDEVRTFAAIMMAREVEPPLAIGLFGDWGSGKSFFMNSLIQTVDKLAARSRATASAAFCGHVVQIKFNAWHYVDTHLWASLVTFILEKLAAHVSPQLSLEKQHAALLTELASAKAVTAEAEAEKRRASEMLTQEERELTKIREERQKKELKLADIRATDVAGLLASNQAIKDRITTALNDAGVPSALDSVHDLQQAVDEARRIRGSTTALIVTISRQKSLPLYIALLLFVLMVVPLVALLLQRYVAELNMAVTAVSAVLVQIVAGVATVTAWIRKGSEIVRNNLAKVESAKAQVDQLIADKRSEVSAAEMALSREVDRLKVSEQQVEDRLRAASARVAEIEARLQSFREAGSLARFLAERTRSDDYRKHLGLISLVRQDFESLAERLSNQRLLGNALVPVERIVLYIDDLDRCPAEKVVDVLQAVHLLLAYKLFVVVVGVDSRWLLNSLASHYAEFRGDARKFVQGGEAATTTPQHYLEKIFQIPYTLRPMDERGYSRLIEQTMGSSKSSVEQLPPGGPQPVGETAPPPAPAELPEDARIAPSLDARPMDQTVGGGQKQTPAGSLMPTRDATPSVSVAANEGGNPSDKPASSSENRPEEELFVREEALLIQPWEIQFAQSLHGLIPSPRSAKRLSNTYRILKARVRGTELSGFEGTEDLPGDFQVPLLLLAMLINAPDAATDWFASLGSNAAGHTSIADALKVNPARPNADPPTDKSTAARAALAARVQQLVEMPTFPRDVKLLTEWIPQVARFSFDFSRGTALSPEQPHQPQALWSHQGGTPT